MSPIKRIQETKPKPMKADKNFELWWLILQLRRAMRRAREKELFDYDISPEESSVLFAAHLIGHRCTPADISRLTLRERHSVSTLLVRMEKAGLVEKTKDLDKKNLVRVSLTELGEVAYQNSLKRDVCRDIFSSLTEEEYNQLRPILEKLRRKAMDGLRIKRAPLYPPLSSNR